MTGARRSEVGTQRDVAAAQAVVDDLSRRALAGRWDVGGVRLLSAPGQPLSDSLGKFLVLDRRKRAVAFAFASPAGTPGAAARNVANAARARARLGPVLGRPVLAELAAEERDGRSFAVFPLCRALADHGFAWRLQRPLVVRWALRWLRDVSVETRRAAGDAEISERFERPLAHLATMTCVDDAVREGTRAALALVRSGAWKPVFVVMHGDLWKGNVLVRRGARSLGGLLPVPQDLVVIDWGTGEEDGYPLFDLVRLARSLRVGTAALQREIARHCAVLGWDRAAARACVLAALGHRGEHLEHFPPERFAQMAASCLATFDGVT